MRASCNCCIEPLAATGMSRRQFVAGAAAVGVAAAAGFAPKVFAQAKPHRIDVHCHIVPPTWFAAMEVIGRSDFPLKNWSVQKLLEDMDKGGVATSMTSPTTPQVTPLGKDVAVRIARESNEYAKKMETDHPGRFGVWATLPLPHIDESLKEIAYAFDTLKVDGVGCMTSYGDKWLGHAIVRAGVGGAEPPQGHGLHPSDLGQLLRQPGAGRAGLRDRVRLRHDAHHRQPDPQRHVAEIQGRQLDLVARRRRAHRLRRAVPVAARQHAAVPRQDHARADERRAQALLLRHRGDLGRRDARRAQRSS